MKKIIGIINTVVGDDVILMDQDKIIADSPDKVIDLVYCLSHPKNEASTYYIIQRALGNKEDNFVCQYHVICEADSKAMICAYANTEEEALKKVKTLVKELIEKYFVEIES